MTLIRDLATHKEATVTVEELATSGVSMRA
jgi:hypothetical protein